MTQDLIPVRREDVLASIDEAIRDRTEDRDTLSGVQGEIINGVLIGLKEARDCVLATISAPPSGEAVGLEWRGDSLYFNGRNIGNIFAVGGDETNFTFLSVQNRNLFYSDEEARSALESAARSWLSPSLSETTKDQAQPDEAMDALECLHAHTRKTAATDSFYESHNQEMDEHMGTVRDALRAPHGCKHVPASPTPEMINAGRMAIDVAAPRNSYLAGSDAYSIAEKVIRAALDASPQAQQSEGVWQPIETAPKDGEVILIWKPNERRVGEYMMAAYWDDDRGGFIPVGGIHPRGYYSEIAKCDQGYPTHWTPLPSPPTKEDQ